MRTTRRTFLRGAAALAAAPYVIPSDALGAGDRPAPSNRITMGFIGTGGQGRGVMGAFLAQPDVQALAVADVNRERRLAARKQVEDRYGAGATCADYGDFRELLGRPDIEAVSIATPDHWHALAVIAAAKAGKDMYCEKPLSLTVAEGRAMCDAVKRYGRIFQHGTQQRSDRNFRHAAELALNGRLGKLSAIKVAAPASVPGPKPQPQDPPAGFDYDFWLGQAPVAPYYEVVCMKVGWYHMSPYTPGFISGWGVHHVDCAAWGMGTDLTGPVEIEGTGEFPKEGLYDGATKWDMRLTYANGLVMQFKSDNIEPHGIRFEGPDGWVFVKRGSIEAEPKSLLTATFGPGDKRLCESKHHQRNLLDCIRSRQPTVSPAESGHRSTSLCLLSDIALRLGRELKWDPEKEQVVDDDAANRLLQRTMRAPWHL